MQNFAAIDFETANCQRTSVCSVGVVTVRGGMIADRFYSLVKPEPEYYNYRCTLVHGLTEEEREGGERGGEKERDEKKGTDPGGTKQGF